MKTGTATVTEKTIASATNRNGIATFFLIELIPGSPRILGRYDSFFKAFDARNALDVRDIAQSCESTFTPAGWESID